MKVVVNTGPLVFLSKIDRLSILRKLGNIYVPKKVMAEVQFKKDDVAEAVMKATNDWLKIKTAKDIDLLNVLSKELDGGEGEVICLALEQKADWVVLDDQDARRFAHRYGLKVVGTLGILAWAKKKGIVKSFRDEVIKLRNSGFYATEEIIERLAKEVKEA